MKKINIFCVCCAALLSLNSCLGVQADITIRADGSGSITLEYRVSQMLESIGRLDGNERWPAIPVGRADFERTAARIPGLRLSSFSTKEVRNATGGSDLVTKVVLEFKDTAALLAFLDSAGAHASLVQDTGKLPNAANVLRLVLLEPAAGLDQAVNNADLRSLLREISAGYETGFSFSLPKTAALSVIPPSVPALRMTAQGKKVSFAIGAGELVDLEDGLAIEIVW